MEDKITLKAARVNAGYTQEEVAKLMGVSTLTIGKWETNSDVLKLKNAKKLCEIYKKNINDIFF